MDPDRYSAKMLDPDPDEMNADPQPWDQEPNTLRFWFRKDKKWQFLRLRFHSTGVVESELLVLLQKVIGHPFYPFACGICELHAMPIMSAIYRWENLI